MHQLIYKSRLNPSVDWNEIIGIAEQARRNNATNNMTGILVNYQDQVLQILEGENKALSTLFLKIANDPRHSQVELLKFGAIPTRHFGNWKMKEVAIERLPDNLQTLLSSLMEEDDTRQLPSDDSKAEALLTLIAAVTSNR
jgi:hypothetical protein